MHKIPDVGLPLSVRRAYLSCGSNAGRYDMQDEDAPEVSAPARNAEDIAADGGGDGDDGDVEDGDGPDGDIRIVRKSVPDAVFGSAKEVINFDLILVALAIMAPPVKGCRRCSLHWPKRAVAEEV